MEPPNLRPLTVEKNSSQQFRRERGLPWSIQSDFVFLVDLVARMGESQRQFAIVRENEQTFALRIEPAHVEESRKFGGQKVENCIARVRIASGRNKTGRFVQNNRERKIDTREFAIDFDMIPLARLHAEIRADSTVDGDSASGNQLVTFSP